MKAKIKILVITFLTITTIQAMAQSKEHINTKSYLKEHKLSASVESEVLIDKSPKEVWAVISNWGDAYLYTPGLDKSYCTTDSAVGISSKRHCVIGSGSVEEQIILFEDQSRFILEVWEFKDIPMITKIVVEFEIFEEGGRTRLRQTMAYKMPMGKLMKGKMRSNIRNNVHAIKHYIETGEADVAKDPKQLKKLYY